MNKRQQCKERMNAELLSNVPEEQIPEAMALGDRTVTSIHSFLLTRGRDLSQAIEILETYTAKGWLPISLVEEYITYLSSESAWEDLLRDTAKAGVISKKLLEDILAAPEEELEALMC